jgi:hypothetical protein
MKEVKMKKSEWEQEHGYCVRTCSTCKINSFRFAGDELGVTVARELFYYLKNEIIRQTSKKSLRGQKLKNDFRLGVVFGLNEIMQVCVGWRDMREKKEGIKEKYFSENPIAGSSVRFVSASFEAGKETAKEINLSRQAGYTTGGLVTSMTSGFQGKL